MKLTFSTHALRRMLRHGSRSERVQIVLDSGERIGEYPDDDAPCWKRS